MIKRIVIIITAAVIVCSTGCHHRQVKDAPKKDPLLEERGNVQRISTPEQLNYYREESSRKIALNPTPEEYYHRAHLYWLSWTTPLYDNVIRDLDSALVLLPPNDTSDLHDQILLSLAYCFMEMEKPQRAFQTIDRLLQDKPDLFEAKEALARFHYELGHEQEAWEILSDSLAFNQMVRSVKHGTLTDNNPHLLLLTNDKTLQAQSRVTEEEKNSAEKAPGSLKDARPVIHIKYNEPINGYDVTVDMYPDADGEDLEHYGPATLHFKKGNTKFDVEIDEFSEDHFDEGKVLKDGETITLKHTPLPKGKMISEDCTIFFSDVDYDGTKELLIKEPLAGPRGTNAYHVYELDGTEREDVPFFAISDLTEFNATEKSITQTEYSGVILGSDLLKYRRQRDGSFALTDSTHIDYKADFTDSIRTHYHKQGDKMVLVKKEVVK